MKDFINNSLWADELKLAITVTDIDNVILYMNEKSKRSYPNSHVGDNLADCHKQSSMDKIDRMIKNDVSNTYTVTRNNLKKLIHHTPWYKDGKTAGIIEFAIEIPEDIQHFDRD